jgi:hypothetical protein
MVGAITNPRKVDTTQPNTITIAPANIESLTTRLDTLANKLDNVNTNLNGLKDSEDKLVLTQEQKQDFFHGRCGKLIALIAILVISWLLVQVWANVFTLFVKKVFKIDGERLVANAILALFFTILIIWAVYYLCVDDLMVAPGAGL